MADIEKAVATQLRNIESRTGKTMAQLIALVRGRGLGRHSEVVAMPKAELGLGHGDANAVAMIGPATNARVYLGPNIKSLPDSSRLEKLPAGQMCSYRVKLTEPSHVDAELLAWTKAAYDAAG